eukprot:TRINITY_DN17775_c0_g1_i1.p2 TRINITY_DN17775_c0_g1~~TRINITY_DN17775_c0_g1_i1.p2  ORF type:complete len:273 (+),score=57.86 TRINITY_DN17775_c0_g1_i1:88-819(+)
MCSSFAVDIPSCMVPRFSLSPYRPRFTDSDNESSGSELWTVRRRKPRNGVQRQAPVAEGKKKKKEEQPEGPSATTMGRHDTAARREGGRPDDAAWAPLPTALSESRTVHYYPVRAPRMGAVRAPRKDENCGTTTSGPKLAPGEAARRVVAKLAARDRAPPHTPHGPERPIVSLYPPSTKSEEAGDRTSRAESSPRSSAIPDRRRDAHCGTTGQSTPQDSQDSCPPATSAPGFWGRLAGFFGTQ